MSDRVGALDIALEEYRALWNYYGRTLDERERLLGNYLKIVALPSGIVVGLSLNSAVGGHEVGNPTGVTDSLLSASAPFAGAILVLLAVIGVSGFLAYAHETKNSRRFLSSINSLREFFRAKYPELGQALNVAPSNQVDVRERVGRTGYYRGGMFLIANCGILAIGLFLSTGAVLLSLIVFSIKFAILRRIYMSIVAQPRGN